jgi:hypothetical protein
VKDDTERIETAETEDAAFDALLRRAAHVSTPASNSGSRLHSGSTLIDGRMRIVRRIGGGGMGVVYESYDERRHGNIALKTLNRLVPGSVYRLKNEFRSLADVSHPNLCRLYELFSDAGDWFFTMELVQGEHFDRWVRPNGTLDEARLRAALPQLVSAITAIHAAGKLHRDLKPSNVLVTQDGRVVVLDFGLAVDPEVGGVGQTLVDEGVTGTPNYMAPEQAAGLSATAASDFYALGVMVFEALTGALPFEGRVLEVLTNKQRDPAPLVLSRNAGAPSDLATLCDLLLEREPSERLGANALHVRPSAAPATARVASKPGPPKSASSTAPPLFRAPETVALLGRDAELATLREAFAASCTAAKPVVVLLSGESGMGKSALCDVFLSELRANQRAVVLSGRCFERESVPFKAFDVVVDELSRYLRKLGDEAFSLMPRDAFALHRIFPVLGRVAAISEAPTREVPDAHELRRRGFAAFAELLGRMRDRQPLVVHLDDLQWSDADSTLLLMHVLSQADAPRCLLVVSHRSEQMEGHPYLSPLYEKLPGDLRLDVRQLRLSPLSSEAARALLRAQVGTSLSGLEREAGGNPFLLGELGRHAALHASEAVPDLSLKSVIAGRAAALPADERRLVELLAVAGRPIDLFLAVEAAGVSAGPRTLFESLRDAHLARATGNDSVIECFHDKVREALLGELSADALHGHHAALARALLSRSDSGAEELAVHMLAAGQAEPASLQLVRAADTAFSELSFARAARLYTQALEHGHFDVAEDRRLRVALGHALTYAGRGAQAARHYFEAARSAEPDQALELERRAAEQLLISGHRSEGLETLTTVLAQSGIAGPNRGPALGRLLWQRLRLRLAGTNFEAKDTASIDPELLRRVDACGVAARTLTVREPVMGAVFGAMHLRLALAAGEPSRVVEGLATEVMYAATEGIRAAKRVEHLIACARNIELTRAEPSAQAYFTTALAGKSLLMGRFAEAADAAALADTIYREQCTGVTGPLNLARCIWAPAMLFMGDIPGAMGPLAAWLQNARDREDLEAEGQLGVYQLYGPLAADDVAAVRDGIEPTLARWQPGQRESAGMTAVHVLAVLECYERASPAVLAAVRELYTPFFSSFMARVQLYRVVVMGYCANLELAIAAQGHERSERLRRAEAFATRLCRERVQYASALGNLARGGAAYLRGDVASAVVLLQRACAEFEGDRQMLWAACTRMRLGRLLGGSEGAMHCARAKHEMTVRGVRTPERFVAVYAPGYPD